jgi:D-3-phosphoglycerate dehydrogenase
LTKCQIIARYGIGVNNVDIKASSENNIIVTNVPDYCISEVSDHALGLIITLARKIIEVNHNAKSGLWSFDSARPIFRLAGKTLGLVGFGNIARSLAGKAQALGMRVIFHDPYFKGSLEGLPGVDQCASLDELLGQSDFVSVHTPLTEETSGMIGLAGMRMMKPGAYLINTSRGGIINESDLLVALQNKVIAGAALDVLANENQVESNPLLNLQNIILTPHCGFYSEESTEELRAKAVNEVISVLTGGKPRYQVNRT